MTKLLRDLSLLPFGVSPALPEWSYPHVWVTLSSINLPGFFHLPLLDCSLTQWEMRLAMIWGRAGYLPLFQNPSVGPFELTRVQGWLIQPLQRCWRLCVTSWLRWPLTRSLHEWKQRGMSSNLSPAERGFQVRPGVFPLWLGKKNTCRVSSR